MMGVVSLGRSLLVRQVLLAGLVVALGAFAYSGIGNIEDVARNLVAGDPSLVASGAATLRDTANAAAAEVVVATAVAALLMLCASLPVMHFTVGRPIKALAAAVSGLAAGDLAVVIEGDNRADELGEMARGLQRMRAEAMARTALAGPATTMAQPADEGRSRILAERLDAFSKDLARTVAQLSTMTKRVHGAAETMVVAARHANDGSEQATGASANAATDVSSVATASEQLLDSIEEISRQVVQSTNVVKSAVERAVETNAGMGRLSSAAQKVGDVVSLISRIAAQTNLLALNATIEAARAGEAGRGFAVVAQEVKTLATQTAKATQDITGQISEMQQATDLSVAAIDKIQSKISEVEHISTIIASAVHEQGAATQEIARNVRSAAAGTASMSGHIEAVVRSIGETSGSAAEVSRLAHELDEIATGMTAMVERFSKTLKAA